MNHILQQRELLTTSASRLTNSEFRYLPYIVIYCFVLYVSVALVFGCILREPRFVVRWTKEKRFSATTASETDDEENEDDEGDENEDEESRDAKLTDNGLKIAAFNRAASSHNVNNSNNHNTSQLGIAVLPDAVPSRQLSRQLSQQLERAMSQRSLRLEIESNSDREHDDDLENNNQTNKRTLKRKDEIPTQDLCCRRGGFCHSWGPTYYRYGLHIVYNSIWHDTNHFWNYLLAATRVASFAYLFYYNLYTLWASRDSPGIWKDFSVWVSCGVVLYFAAVSLVSLLFGLCVCLHASPTDGRRRAFLLASALHVLFETVLVNACFVTLLSYLYFAPTHAQLTQGYRYPHLRLFPAGFMFIEGLQTELYVRWQTYPCVLLLPGLYLVFQWVARYLGWIDQWQDTVLATDSVYAFLAYGGLLAAHLAVYLVLGLGVSWMKIRGRLWCREWASESDEFESDDEEEGEQEGEDEEVAEGNEVEADEEVSVETEAVHNHNHNHNRSNNAVVRAEDVAVHVNI